MGLTIENNIIKIIAEHYGDSFLGMTGTDESMTIKLKDKELIIKNINLKSLEEIIKEIDVAVNKNN